MPRNDYIARLMFTDVYGAFCRSKLSDRTGNPTAILTIFRQEDSRKSGNIRYTQSKKTAVSKLVRRVCRSKGSRWNGAKYRKYGMLKNRSSHSLYCNQIAYSPFCPTTTGALLS
jgi:hypothetical protein